MRVVLDSIVARMRSVPGVPPPPDFSHNSSLYFVVQLATGVGTVSHRPAAPIPTGSREFHWLPLKDQSDRLKRATDWVAHLTSMWRLAIATERDHEPAARAGAELVNLMANFHRRMLSIRRRHMQNSHEYMSRSRDPQ